MRQQGREKSERQKLSKRLPGQSTVAPRMQIKVLVLLNLSAAHGYGVAMLQRVSPGR